MLSSQLGSIIRQPLLHHLEGVVDVHLCEQTDNVKADKFIIGADTDIL